MNKFLLLVLLILVQSKKLNTFQEFGDRNLNDKDIEKLRNNKEFKEYAYKFYELLKGTDDEKLVSAINDDYENVKNIIQNIFKNFYVIMAFGFLDPYEAREKLCIIDENNLRPFLIKAIDLFYEKKDDELIEMGGNLINSIPTIMRKAKNCKNN